MMNGTHQQRYMQMGLGQKYQHQQHQQHNSQQNHQHHQHHHQQNVAGPNLGHQHTFSSGTLSNSTPNFTANNLHNGNSNNNQIGLNDSYASNQHWQRQMHLAAESRQAQSAPHHHCKKDGVISRVRALDQATAEEPIEDGEEERNRAITVAETSRQDWDSLDCSGQGLRALSPSLFVYDFLSKLYLDHNRLSRLNPVIGQLRKLTYLDISNNQIMELPAEIGMLVNLKELLAFDNNLHSLPNEIGYLYKLETLGIEGNPLDEHIREHIMLSGTKSIITHIREHAARTNPLSLLLVLEN